MKNQKGFSLIELVVVIAIIGLLGIAVFGFIVTGTHSYKGVSDEADLQYNAQLVVNQIENLVIDTTKGISYSYLDGAGTVKEVLSDADIKGTPDTKMLTIYNSGEVYYISWKDKVVSLQKDIVDASGEVTSAGKNVKMADNVSSFAVDLTNAKNSVVSLNFIFESGKKKYTSNKQLTLRNVLAINGKVTDMYDEEPELAVTVDRVTLSYNGASVTDKEVGLWVKRTETSLGSMRLVATVHGSVLLSEVIWNVSSCTSEATTIDGGNLVIGPDETSDRIVVTAISKNDTSKSASTTVVLKEITGISADITVGAKDEYYKGDVLRVSANVNGINLTAEDKEVSWSASGASLKNSNNVSADVTINASANQQVFITATSKADSNYKAMIGPITVAVSNFKVSISGIDSSTKLLRNDTISGIKASVSPSSGYGEIKWKLTKMRNNSSGKNIPIEGVSLGSSTGEKNSITCSSDLNWSDSYTVSLMAYVESGGETFESGEISVSIDPVMVRVWDGYTKYDVTKGSSKVIKAAKGATKYYGYEVFGIKAKMETNSTGSQYVAATEMYDDAFKVVLTSNAKNSEPKIPIIILGQRLDWLYFNTN